MIYRHREGTKGRHRVIYISVLFSITQFEDKSFLKEKTRKKRRNSGTEKNHVYHIAKYLFQPGVLRKQPFKFRHNLNS